MIQETLQDIPRLLTALAEWAACLLYVALVPKRVARVSVVLVLAAGLVLLVEVQSLAAMLPLSLWSLGMALAGASMYAIIWACTDTDLKGAGDLVARGFVLAELVASLEWQLDQHFFGGDDWGVARVGLIVFVYGFAFTAAWFAERRNFPAGRPVTADGRALAATLSIAVVTFLMSNLSFVPLNTPFSGREGREVFYIRTLVDFAGFIALYAMRSHRLQLERSLEVKSMASLIRLQHDQYLRSRQQMDTVNARYHDMKYYIAAIRLETDAAARSTIVDGLEASIRDYGSLAVETGNPVVDTMLTSKASQADLEGITITSVIDGAVVDFMDVMDVVTVFGNALDNAIEATRRVADPERRLIRIAVYRQDHFALLRFENYFGGRLTLLDGLPATTKEDPQNHGFGLKNIRQAVEKYDGTFTVRTEDGWFVLRMLIPLP